MTLVGIVTMMICAMVLGKRSTTFGMKQYGIVALLTLIQLALVTFYMYTNVDLPHL